MAQGRFVEEEIGVNRPVEIILLVVMVATFTVHIGIHAYQVAANVPPAQRIPWTILAPVFSVFAMAHALFMLGWRRAVAFFGLTAVIAFGFEFVGQATGVIFGRYAYTDVLGWKLFGIPVTVLLVYFMVIYPCTVITNLIISAHPVTQRNSVRWVLWSAVLTAFIMTAWDLTLDPLMANQVKAWLWLDGGQYFAVPFQNFFGWLATTFSIATAYRFAERGIRLAPLGRMKKWIVILPVAGFAALSIGDLFIGYPVDTRAIPLFVMGVPVLAALLHFYEPLDTPPTV